MAPATRARMHRQPPTRGRPYYDVDRGRQMIVPPGGGKAVDYVGPSERSGGFQAGKAMRRAGVAAAKAGDRAAASARPVARLRRADALPDLGGGPGGLGGVLIYGFASIIGLALLENALSGRGPAAVETVLNTLGGGIRRLVDPRDPMINRGTPTAAATGAGILGTAVAGRDVASSSGARGGKVTVAPNANRPGVPLHPQVIAFVRTISGLVGMPLTIGTGSNHSRLTVDGNESAHYTGWAADIPARGAQLIKLGRAALVAAGMPAAQANKQTGGLYNVGGYQVIFNTQMGGDHTDHLHVGIASWAQGGR